MVRPRVAVYNEVSVDGRITGFAQHPGRYYQLGIRWSADGILMGSATALAFGPAETLEQQAVAAPAADAARPGRVRGLGYPAEAAARGIGQRGPGPMLAGRIGATLVKRDSGAGNPEDPAGYLAYLDRCGVEWSAVGDERVDLSAGLAALGQRGLELVRTDGGGHLTGAPCHRPGG